MRLRPPEAALPEAAIHEGKVSRSRYDLSMQCLDIPHKEKDRRPGGNCWVIGGGFGLMPARVAGLPAAETRFAFVDEGLSGFAVVLGEPGVRMMGHFQVHAFTEFAGYGPVQVLLHVAVSDRRPLR